MRTFLRAIILGGSLLVTGSALEAQRQMRPIRPIRPMVRRVMADPAGRQAMRQRLQSLTPQQRMAMRQRLQSLAPQQRTALRQRMQAARAERRRLAQGLRSGQLTRPQARAQLREWRRTNRLRPPRPGGLGTDEQ